MERFRQGRRRWDGFTAAVFVAISLGLALNCLAQSTRPAESVKVCAVVGAVGASAASVAQAQAASLRCVPIIPAGVCSGDLIFRKGTERISDFVCEFDSGQCESADGDCCVGAGGGQFSHVGILISAHDLSDEFRAVAEQSCNEVSGDVGLGSGLTSDDQCEVGASSDEWFVLHATPSEVEGRADTVVLDPIGFFTSPARSQLHVVYHVTDADDAQRRAAVDTALAQLGKPFSLTKAEGVYCTELVYDAWLSGGVNLEVRFHKISLLLFPERELLLPSSLLASPKLERLEG